jgi:hypothetical protein
MMYGLEKSDLCVVAVKSANKFAQARRSRWSEGEGPRETPRCRTCAGLQSRISMPQQYLMYEQPQYLELLVITRGGSQVR